jgi:exonuclease III
MTVVNWNVEWTTPRSRRRDEILSRVDREAPNVVCLTEADTKLLADWPGHTIHSQPDGVKGIDNLRKVVLWSKEPWHEVDDVGSASMPPGRFVSGVTRTSCGEVTVIGVCIPYRDSRVQWTNDGIRRKRWEDHREYLARLPEVFKHVASKRLIMIGDFNQQIGQTGYAPERVRDLLRDAIPSHITIATAALGFGGRRVIDHIALSKDMSAASLRMISRFHEHGELSDHHGVVAKLSAPA